MPAAVFMNMNRVLQRTFAHSTPVIWHRPDGPAEGHQLKAWWDAAGETVDADGFRVVTSKPSVTVFVTDILSIDPARAEFDLAELFDNDGSDSFTVDGIHRRVESCTPDGYGKVIVTLKR